MESEDLDAKLKKMDGLIEVMRKMRYSDSEVEFPLHLSDGDNGMLQVDPLHFKLGEWTPTPWPEVSCMGIHLSKEKVVVICKVEEPIRFQKHNHGPWSETLTMHEGSLYEHTTGETYEAGSGFYYYHSKATHEPEFITPSLCMITWHRR